jgi:hypothetical protein
MKKILIACLLSILLSSCANPRLTEKHYNENRECSLQLLLESSVDTVYRGLSEKVLKVSLINTSRKPYYIREPFVSQYHNIDFHEKTSIKVEYQHGDCSKWFVKGSEEIIKRVPGKYMYLTHKKPYIVCFSPCFDELFSYCGRVVEKKGAYQLRTYYVLGTDTIYSNSVSLYYVDDAE